MKYCVNCANELTFVKYPNRKNRMQLRKQCFSCGLLHSLNYKFSLVNMDETNFYSPELYDKYKEVVKRKRKLRKQFFENGQSFYRDVYLRSDEWKRKRLLVLRRDDYKCRSCFDKARDVHHITYSSVYSESLSQLISLCRDCHKKIHSDDDDVLIDGIKGKDLKDCNYCGGLHDSEHVYCTKCNENREGRYRIFKDKY